MMNIESNHEVSEKRDSQELTTHSYEDIINELTGRLEKLKIVSYELQVSNPSIVPSAFALCVGIILLIGTAALALAPYAGVQISPVISTVAAFLVVAAVFITYSALRMFTADLERRHLYVAVSRRADYLVHRATELLMSTSSRGEVK